LSSENAKEEQRLRKHTPLQSSSGDEPVATKIRHFRIFFHPDEEAWFQLFHSKLRAGAEASEHIKLSGSVLITQLFSAYSKGRVLQDEAGQKLPPREACVELSIKNKIVAKDAKVGDLGDAVRKLFVGRCDGVLYLPTTTE
jgi:hypothetical protein